MANKFNNFHKTQVKRIVVMAVVMIILVIAGIYAILTK
ncbi:DUF4044 domain-containing protein [Fructilactobacillus fructivorans]|uniref:Uncharacterized protein n=1 Tax=Fructilactobacillus fructivorans TaxID=1614 RepID=A0A0C1PQX8_9LACO|nr:hypothetical protein LfDm3_0210 [Fructilactobacillus fructivorans]